jgi:D-galactose 1-dehydrogenase
VLLEKPPSVTLGEIADLACLAEARPVTLLTTWHSQENPTVAAAARALAGTRIASMKILWHEDVHKWHPGQRWIWEPGGFGVFDPGINAFSILTKIFPGEVFVREADLQFPENADTPIAADIRFFSPVADGPLDCSLDFRRTEGEEWTITIATVEGREVHLTDGGGRLFIDGAQQPCEGAREYAALYQRFVDLIDERRSHVDVAPLRLVADTLLVARRHSTAAVMV